MRLDWLQSFVTFAELLNFTRAAARLHVSQPALHEQVAQLAQAYGVVLYRRVGRTLVLTEEGRALEVFARDFLARHAGFASTLRGEAVDAPIVLCAGRGTHLHLLAPLLRTWRGQLTLETADRDGTLDAVRTGRAHVGVAPLEVLPESLEVQILRTVGQCAVVASAHRLARRARLSLADLDSEPLILPPRGRPHRETVTRALTTEGVRASVVVEVGDWELMMLYASLGIGVAIVNDFCAPPRGARRIPITDLPSLDYHVFVRRSAVLPARTQELVGFLRGAPQKRGR